MVSVQKISLGAVVKHNDSFWKVENISVVDKGGSKKYEVSMQNVTNNDVIGVSYSHGEHIEEVSVVERNIEFLYFDEGKCFFLDIDTLDILTVDEGIVSQKRDYLKEEVVSKGMCCGDVIFSVELPQFLEIMVTKISEIGDAESSGHSYANAVLETGATLKVPSFIEVGDIVKVAPRQNEYIQRV